MAAVQADLTDRTISHATTLLRYSAHEEQEVLRQMKRLERDLVRDLTRANLTSFRKDRYERLLKQTRQTIRGHYKTIRDTQQKKMEEVARLESRWSVLSLNQAISKPIGVYVDLASVAWTAPQLKAIASNAIIDGSPAKEWWATQAGDTQRRFATEVKQGLLRGETTETIIRTVRQSVMPVSHHQAEALVRSSISAVSHEARMSTYKQNENLISGYRQLSTLDSRTCVPGNTLIAIPGGEKPISEFHLRDIVLGGSGNPRQVVGTKRTTTKKIAIVKLSNGQTIRCTPDHLFLLAHQEWVEAKELSPGVRLAERQEV